MGENFVDEFGSVREKKLAWISSHKVTKLTKESLFVLSCEAPFVSFVTLCEIPLILFIGILNFVPQPWPRSGV